MEKVTLDVVTNRFDTAPTSPYTVEKIYLEFLFSLPPIRLTSAIFGTGYAKMELPCWDFEADARRHASYCVKNGKDEFRDIVLDYWDRIYVPSQEIIVNNGAYHSLLNGIIGNLPPSRNKVPYHRIVRGRFGFDGKSRDVDTLSKELAVTRECVRYLEDKALKKMRHPSRSSTIREYLEQRRWEFLRYLRETGMLE